MGAAVAGKVSVTSHRERDWDDGAPSPPPPRMTAAESFTAAADLLLAGLSITAAVALTGPARLMAVVAVLAAAMGAVQLLISVRLRRECERLRVRPWAGPS